MSFRLEAACGCHIGRIRTNNEDNFYFDGRCLEEVNRGLKEPVPMRAVLRREVCCAVFDGMGGESFGECASFAAVDCLKTQTRRLKDYFIPAKRFLTEMCYRLNGAVVAKAKELNTSHMGTTLVALYFTHKEVYVCNLGDSRAYRLREGEFLQLSVDHIERRKGDSPKKAPLTQYLGIDPEEFRIEPFIAKGELKRGDQYLLCSDGLTDMLSHMETVGILSSKGDTLACVQQLIDAALEHGGKDNVTVILCRIL